MYWVIIISENTNIVLAGAIQNQPLLMIRHKITFGLV